MKKGRLFLLGLVFIYSNIQAQEIKRQSSSNSEKQEVLDLIKDIQEKNNPIDCASILGSDKQPNVKFEDMMKDFDYTDSKIFFQKNKNLIQLENHEILIDLINPNLEIVSQEQKYLKGLKCYHIADKYDVVEKRTKNEYKYDNDYFVFLNSDSSIVATIYFIDRQVAFLREKFRVFAFYNELQQKPSLEISPNPAHSQLNVSYNVNKPGYYTLNILDINGQIVQSIFSNKFFDVSKNNQQIQLNIKSGNYIVLLQTGSIRLYKKISVI